MFAYVVNYIIVNKKYKSIKKTNELLSITTCGLGSILTGPTERFICLFLGAQIPFKSLSESC